MHDMLGQTSMLVCIYVQVITWLVLYMAFAFINQITGGALVKIVHYLMSPGQESVRCCEISVIVSSNIYLQ